jgi:hypothetical protein
LRSTTTPESTSLSTDDMGMIAKRSADFNLASLVEVTGMCGDTD